MIPRKCKRLAEVDFPVARVSRNSVEGSRSATLSALHLWWSRKPLSACRAIMLALLLPDPCDPLCPRDFKLKAWSILRGIVGRAGGNDEALRHALLDYSGPWISDQPIS